MWCCERACNDSQNHFKTLKHLANTFSPLTLAASWKERNQTQITYMVIKIRFNTLAKGEGKGSSWVAGMLFFPVVPSTLHFST